MCGPRFGRATTWTAIYVWVACRPAERTPSGVKRGLETAEGCSRLGHCIQGMVQSAPVKAPCIGFQNLDAGQLHLLLTQDPWAWRAERRGSTRSRCARR